MDKTLVSKLKLIVNTPNFQNAFSLYLDYRYNEAIKILEQANSVEDMKFAQGKISEINFLKGIRDRVSTAEKRLRDSK